jgi:hypothetical protein
MYGAYLGAYENELEQLKPLEIEGVRPHRNNLIYLLMDT